MGTAQARPVTYSKRTIPAQVLHAVDVLIATIVAGTGLALAVLVGHAAAKGLHDRHRCEVF